MGLKNIVFDFDGVLADTADIIFSLFREMNSVVTKEHFMAHHDGNVYEEPVVEFSLSAQKQFYKDYSNRLSASHIAESIDPVKLYAQSFNLFIISSNEEYAINAVLEEAGITNCFKAVYGYNTHKSKVAKFEMLKNQYGVDFNETIFITDTLGDIKEGNKLGVRVIAVTFGFHPRERLEQADTHAIVDTWEEVKTVIDTLAKN